MSLRVGRYETIRAIASGGMATVYLGRALGAGGFERLVAIKSMHPHIATDPDFVAMFLDEARLAARVRHPNVVATIDVQEDPLFLVMEYIEGPSLHLVLRELRKSKQSLPLDIAMRVFLDVLAGLHAAHELIGPDGEHLNLVHRDVSPQNMLIGVDGISRITDFGVARAESRLSSTRGGQLKGKLAYMAPEQIKAEVIDRRCDIYAAGAVLWEMLTNQKLFKGDNDGAIVAQALGGVKTPPREVAPQVPEAIDAVCMKALALSRDDRYATASDFADAVEDAAIASGVPIATPRAVSAMVKQIRVHEGPSEGGSGPGSRKAERSASAASRAPASSPSGFGPPSVASSSAPKTPLPPPPGGSGIISSVPSSTSVEAVMSTPPPPRPRWRAPVVVAVIGIAGGAVAALLAGGRVTDAEPAAQGSTSAAEVAPPTPASAAPAEIAPPPATASAASAAPSASASAAATSRAAAKGSPAHAVPAKGGKPDKPAASPTSFRPSDL